MSLPDYSSTATLSLVREMCASGQARQLRQAKGLSLREVGDAIGTSAAIVARWETGKTRPRKDAALRLAALYSELIAATEEAPE